MIEKDQPVKLIDVCWHVRYC